MKYTVSAAALAAALAIPTGALALPGSVTTDLNMRAGPGPTYPIVTTIDNNSTIEVEGCIESGNWCQVSWNGQTGWAYANYISHEMDGSLVVLPEARARIDIPTVSYEGSAGAAVGAAGGAITGAILGGPVGAAVGGIAGLAAGAVTDPPQRVRTYVQERERAPVYLDGEVVIGARLPDTVSLYDVPDYDYRYAYVNGQPVLVEPGSRQIVYVYR